MPLIEDDEREDFVDLLRRHRFDPEDFELSEHEDKIPAYGVFPVTGIVYVRRRSSDVLREYSKGAASIWITAFLRELLAGVYGQP